MSQELIVLIVSMLPVSELRGAIPLAIGAFNMPLHHAFLLSVLGNIIPVIFILLLLKSISDFLIHKSYFFNRFFNWLFEKTRKRHSRKFERFERFALILLVAIPLPFTGAWTGSLAAFVFGIPLKKAFPLICIGVLIAGVVVSLATVGIINLPIL